MPLSAQDVLKNIVVYIKVNGKVHGTGFFIDEFGNLLTCYHIFSPVYQMMSLEEIDQQTIEVEFQNRTYAATAVHTTSDPITMDIVILKVEEIDPQTLYIADFKPYDNTQSLITCGYRSEELDGSRCNGVVHIEHSEDMVQRGFILLDDSSSHHKIIKGLSGSPIVEENSKAVVGIIVGRINEQYQEYDEAVSIPISQVATIFEPLRIKIQQYEKYLKLEQIFITNSFLSEGKREKLTKDFCQLFFGDAYTDFQSILHKMKRGNLIDIFIEWLPHWIDRELRRDLELKPLYFENREKSLREILSATEGSTFITIDGALSCGKTQMLTKLKESFEKESWICHLIRCSHPPSTANEVAISLRSFIPIDNQSANKLDGNALGNYLVRSKSIIEKSFKHPIKGIALLFDDVDRIREEREFEQFLELIGKINAILFNCGIHSKIIIAGNGLSDKMDTFAYQFDFVRRKKKIVLKPFNYENVKRFILNSIQQPILNSDCITARFFYLTNGHPGLMSALIESDTIHVEKLCDRLYWRNLNRQEIYAKIHEIFTNITQRVTFADIFNRLAYFRYFDDAILQQVYEKWFQKRYQLKNPKREILKSNIIQTKEESMVEFNIRTINRAIRTIFLLHGRETEQFVSYLQEAQAIYKAALQELLDSYPKDADVHIDTHQITLYFQESLYLELHILFYRNNTKGVIAIETFIERFEAELNVLIDQIVQIQHARYKQTIEEILIKIKQGFQSDDFKFAIGFFSTLTLDSQPYRQVMERILALEEEIVQEG